MAGRPSAAPPRASAAQVHRGQPAAPVHRRRRAARPVPSCQRQAAPCHRRGLAGRVQERRRRRKVGRVQGHRRRGLAGTVTGAPLARTGQADAGASGVRIAKPAGTGSPLPRTGRDASERHDMARPTARACRRRPPQGRRRRRNAARRGKGRARARSCRRPNGRGRSVGRACLCRPRQGRRRRARQRTLAVLISALRHLRAVASRSVERTSIRPTSSDIVAEPASLARAPAFSVSTASLSRGGRAVTPVIGPSI